MDSFNAPYTICFFGSNRKQTNFIKKFYTKKKNVYPDFIKFLLYYPKPKLMQIRLAD